jgi:hypothetical protein
MQSIVFFSSIRSSELVHRLGYLAFTEKSRVRFPDSEVIFLLFFYPQVGESGESLRGSGTW